MPLPSHTLGIHKLTHQITTAIYLAVAAERISRLDIIFTGWETGRPAIVRRPLFPINLAELPKDTLIASLGQDYFNAQVCKAALHAFAAENEALMKAMSSAGMQIARELETFQVTLRRVRQEAITAEIIGLKTGAATARNKQ